MKIKNIINKISVLLLVVSFGMISIDSTAQIPPYFNNNTAVPNNAYPFSVASGMHFQSVIVANSLTGAPTGIMDTLWIKTNPNVTCTYTSLDIGIRQVAGLTTGAYTPGTFTNIFTGSAYVATSNASGWLAIPLTTGYTLDPSLGYVLDIIQCGATSSTMDVANFTGTGNGRTYSSIGSCPQTYSNQSVETMAMGVSLTGLSGPPFANDYSTASSGNFYPLGSSTTNNRVQFLYGPNQFSTLGAGAGTVATGKVDTLWVRVGSSSSTTFGSKTYTNFEVSIGQNQGTSTTLTGLTWNTGLTSVFAAASHTMSFSSLNEWLPIPLTTPFTYNPAQSLMIEIKHTGSTGPTVFMADALPTQRRYGTTGNPTAGGTSNNGYMIGMSTCASTAATITPTICAGTAYTSPSTNYTYTTAGTYMDTIANATNCDSIITINLTVNTISSIATTVSGITITATNAAATYVWLDCNNSNTPIPGATSQSFTPPANGNYAVEITENGCVDTSACVPITTVGIIESSISTGFQVYPNPTKNNIQLELNSKNGINLELKLVDINGRTIQNLPVKTTQGLNRYNMNIGDHADGLYHLQVYENSQLVYTQKVIKE